MSIKTLLFDDKGKFRTYSIGSLVTLFFISFIVCTYFWPIRTVPTGSRGVMTSGGKIVGVEDEGWTVVAPWHRLDNFSIRAEQADINNAEGSTSDTQPVHVNLTVRYSIFTDKVAVVYEKYSHTGDLSSIIQTASQEVFKAVTAKYTAPDLIAKRSQVSADILALLTTKMTVFGAQIISIDMRNFSFSESYMKAINDKVTEEQKKLAAENMVNRVRAEEQQKVVVAEAQRDAVKAEADGEAYSVKVRAKAQADALQVQNDALAKNRDVLELRRIEVEMKKAEKWDGALPVNMYAGAPIPFMTPTQYEKPSKSGQ